MSKRHESSTPEILTWIREQRVFFVATAPRALDGHINVSPKGGDSFRVLGPLGVVYQDFTESSSGSALFRGHPKSCAYGYARIKAGDPRYAEFVELFRMNPGTRAF